MISRGSKRLVLSTFFIYKKTIYKKIYLQNDDEGSALVCRVHVEQVDVHVGVVKPGGVGHSLGQAPIPILWKPLQ